MKGWKKIFHTNGDQKKAGVAILISDKINFKINTVKRDKKSTLHNDQRINTRRRYNNYKYICTQHKSTAIGKVNAAAAAAAAKSLQSCPTLCDPIDGSLPGSPIPGILQARTLEWVAISFSNAGK